MVFTEETRYAENESDEVEEMTNEEAASASSFARVCIFPFFFCAGARCEGDSESESL